MTAETFTPEPDWSKVSIGDRVRMTTDDNTLIGAVIGMKAFEGMVESIRIRHHSLLGSVELLYGVWDLSVRAKPAHELPTEPGIYCGTQTGPLVPFVLNAEGRWRTTLSWIGIPDNVGQLVRLEPVAETARKVLDWTLNRSRTHNEFFSASADAAREHFGVTDD